VEAQWFDVIGLSLSRVLDTAKIAKDISRMRQASINKNVIVQIGGGPFSEKPELATAVGADATALDGRQAVLQITAMTHFSEQKTP
jgi:methanogenic corrinoid protein MtbC1